MQDAPMFFPIAPNDFLKQIRATIEEVVSEKLNQANLQTPNNHLPEKAFLKINDVCAIFQVSKPTIYDWMKQDKIKSFKIKSRRYFLRTEIEAMMKDNNSDL